MLEILHDPKLHSDKVRHYALRRLSRFVSLEFTKNVCCAVLLIRYAVPAKPHNQHVRACHKTVTEIAEAYENVTVAEID